MGKKKHFVVLHKTMLQLIFYDFISVIINNCEAVYQADKRLLFFTNFGKWDFRQYELADHNQSFLLVKNSTR